MSAATATCTVHRASGPCGATAAWTDGTYAECAAHAADPGSMASAAKGVSRVGTARVGDVVAIHRHGKVYAGTVTRVGARGAVYASVVYDNGARREVRV